jgi:hypothetical protein
MLAQSWIEMFVLNQKNYVPILYLRGHRGHDVHVKSGKDNIDMDIKQTTLMITR